MRIFGIRSIFDAELAKIYPQNTRLAIRRV